MRTRNKRARFLSGAMLGIACCTLATPGVGAEHKPAAPLHADSAPQSPQAYIQRSVEAPRQVDYIGESQRIRFGEQKTQASIVRIEHQKPNLTRLWFVAPEEMYGNEIITRGRYAYHIDPRHKRVTEWTHPDVDDADSAANYALIERNYRAEFGPHETVAGRSVVTMYLFNRYTGEKAVTLGVDAATGLILKKEEYRSSGAVSTEMHFDRIRYTAAMPPGIFSTAIPAGYRVIVRGDQFNASGNTAEAISRSGIHPLTPEFLPDGFTLVGTTSTRLGDNAALHLLYSDGIRSLSLFESHADTAPQFSGFTPRRIKLRDTNATIVENGPSALLSWRTPTLTLALIGDLPEADLIKIAEKLH